MAYSRLNGASSYARARRRYGLGQSEEVDVSALIYGEGLPPYYYTDIAPDNVPVNTTTPSTDSISIIDKLFSWGGQIMAAKNQYDINQINLERIKRGLPPLPASYVQAIAPRVSVGLAPEQQRLLILLAIGIGAVLLLARK